MHVTLFKIFSDPDDMDGHENLETVADDRESMPDVFADADRSVFPYHSLIG